MEEREINAGIYFKRILFERNVVALLVKSEILIEQGQKATTVNEPMKFIRVKYWLMVHIVKCKMSKQYRESVIAIVQIYLNRSGSGKLKLSK